MVFLVLVTTHQQSVDTDAEVETAVKSPKEVQLLIKYVVDSDN